MTNTLLAELQPIFSFSVQFGVVQALQKGGVILFRELKEHPFCLSTNLVSGVDVISL